jgi:quinohemoprotein ethanol dehydrogenase
MSFNPTTGLVYIPTSTNNSSSYAVDPNFTVKPGRSNTGLKPGGRGAANAGTAQRLPPPPAIGPVPPNGERKALVAWDPVTQTERWRAPEGGSIGGGTVTTAGNLVFQVTNDGRLLAYSADKGEKLLEIKTDLGGGMGPPITYQIDGRQYVTFAGGVGKVVPRYQDAPGEAPPAAAAGPNAPPDLAGPPSANQTTAVPPRLLTFVLDSKGQ